jgi:hypothetical protein
MMYVCLDEKSRILCSEKYTVYREHRIEFTTFSVIKVGGHFFFAKTGPNFSCIS